MLKLTGVLKFHYEGKSINMFCPGQAIISDYLHIFCAKFYDDMMHFI